MLIERILTDPFIWLFCSALVALTLIARWYGRLPVLDRYDTQRALSMSDVPLPPKPDTPIND